MAATIERDARTVRLDRGRLAVEVALDPLRVSINRAGGPVVDDLRLGLRSGSGSERLIQITEGVVPEETWGELEPVTAAIVEERST